MLEKDHCCINQMGNCYGWESWCHMDCCTGFISWSSRHIHNMKSSMRWITSFLVKKKLISILLIAYVFTKVFMFIVDCICSALSFRLSAQFCPQLPHGCFACCCLNMSFIHIPLLKPKTLPAVYADLVNPWISRNISAYFGDVMFLRSEGNCILFLPDTQEQRLFVTSDCWHCQNKADMEIFKII